MTLDDATLKDGLKFIVGDWEPDFIVNAFSNDLAHIPASEFKSEDGSDLTALKFAFNADNTVEISGLPDGRTEAGKWEQTGLNKYSYTLTAFDAVEDSFFKTAATTLDVLGGNLVFSLGFFAVSLKKISDFDVGPSEAEILTNAPDDGMTGIEGRYEVAKALAMVGDNFGFFTRAEVEEDLKKRAEAGTVDEHDAAEALRLFNAVVEFTTDRKVIMWMQLPEGVSDEEIKNALEAGQIKAIKDGFFYTDASEFKSVDGKFYYNSGSEYELFDEKQSPWMPLDCDEEGLLNFSGMIKLRKI